MKEITRRMINMWKMKTAGFDWMGYTFENVHELSYHHLIKNEDGGLYTFDNGSVLNKNTGHPYLHLIECKDYDMYVYLNNMLKKINEQGSMPDKNQLIAIRNILIMFEKEHDRDRNHKGKILIKKEYVEKRIKI